MKLVAIQRGMTELPFRWITALRKVQKSNRGLGMESSLTSIGALKVMHPGLSPQRRRDEAYLKQHTLPNLMDDFDPAKADEKARSGLQAHTQLGSRIAEVTLITLCHKLEP